MEQNEASSVQPENWQDLSVWMKSVASPENVDKFARALLTDTTSQNSRLGALSSVLVSAKRWGKFAMFLGGEDRARKVLDVIDKVRLEDGVRAMRILDLLFDSTMAQNLQLVGMQDIMTDFNESDFDILIEQLRDSKSLFLNDDEMNKLNNSPRDSDPVKRPIRFLVGKLYSGKSEIPGLKGNLQKSIDFCKKEYLKI